MVTADRQLRGAFTALVTPFTSDGAVDERRFREFVAWQVLAGIDGVVPIGTTGESPTLSSAERDAVIDWTIETVRANEHGRRYIIERDLTSMAEVEAIVSDYVREAARWDAIPAEPCGLTDAIEARLA